MPAAGGCLSIMPGTKTRVALIHNEAAGDASHSRDWLLQVLSRAGYAVDYYRHKRPAIEAALDSAASLIAVAGGDGTVARVAAAARLDGPPIAILPLGTGNKTLIVDAKTNEKLVRGARNLARSQWLAPEGLNVYDILRHEVLVLTQDAAKLVTEALKEKANA